MQLYLLIWLTSQVITPSPAIPSSEISEIPPTAEQAIIGILLKAIQQLVEKGLEGVLAGVVVTLWFIYRYSGFRQELEKVIKKIDKIDRRQRIIIQGINTLGGSKKGDIAIDSEEPTTDEL